MTAFTYLHFTVNDIVNLFTVEKYCRNVARHGYLHAADSKNVVSKAHCVENSQCIQDDEQVCCNLLNQLHDFLFKLLVL